MDEKCVQTFQALEVFIQTQRAALNQTLSDIERLQVLRNNFVQNCSTETLLEQVANDKALLEYEVPKPSIPGLHWSVFENHDPSALKEFASKLRQKLTERNQPHNRQRSPLSELQKLVKQQRQIIVDPVLASLEPLSEPEIESEEEVDPEELKKEREREKIRELKKCKIRSCGLKLPSFRARGASGVFIRHDLDDESMEVDISLDEGLGSRSQPTSVDIYPTITIPASSLDTPPPVSSANNSSRKRRPTARLKDTDGAADESDGKRSKKKSKKSEASIPTKPSSSSAIQSPDLSQSKKENALTKPKPETYKQAWSVSEQQLLEQLLEQIPEGEKFRWQKISRAMDGKRTPRQVASRVQKYFEKLKRYGLGPT